MDMLSILALATQCATAAPAPVVAAMVVAETSGEIYSIQIDGVLVMPTDFDEAVQAAASGLLQGATVKIGIANIATQEFDRRGIAYSEGFSACRNLEVAGEILHESWKRFGRQDEHWRLAVLEMATGNPAMEGEFSQKFDTALSDMEQLVQNTQKQSDEQEIVTIQEAQSPIKNETVLSESAKTSPSWNVYDRASSNPLLVFSK